MELIYVIEDDDNIRDLIRIALEGFGYRVKAFESAEEGLAAMEREKPDLVLVHGDTSTTFAGALAAFYHQIAVGHVEAGLRTWDRYSPFPEEMNRTLVGDLASLHFCPTPANRENLLQEGIRDGIFVTGNTVIDASKPRCSRPIASGRTCSTRWTIRGSGSFWSPATGGRTMASPWKTSWRPAPPGGGFSGGGTGLSRTSVPGGAGGGPAAPLEPRTDPFDPAADPR